MDAAQTLAAEPLWTPATDARDRCRLGRYLGWLERTRGLVFADYQALHRWSVTDLAGFWGSLWEYFEITSDAPPTSVVSGHDMPGARWFDGARLNYAEHILDGRFDPDAVAVLARSQTRADVEWTFAQLADQVGRARAGLLRIGVRPGDRVVGYLPNIPEALVAFLACASVGAVWATCAPEFGERAVVDRFAQIEPTVLLAVSGYVYGDKYVDRTAQVASIASALPTLRHVVDVPYGREPVAAPAHASRLGWNDIVVEPAPLAFDRFGFDHPLCILFSSGTTGLPKAIVHGHGGLVIEPLKNHALSWDLGPGDRLMWFTTTAWMMWTALVSTLLTGASIVMLDGNPMYPDPLGQWRTAAETGATMFGLSPNYLAACRQAGVEPATVSGLRVRIVCTAGAPLAPDSARWIYDSLGPDVLLINGSGGTDVCTGIVQGNPLLPVWPGPISGRCLGVASAAFDTDGRAVVGELGELVITEPMPSMPVGFWGDPDGRRLRDTYFDVFAGVWRQGDWVMFSEQGSCVVTGRSDATLNRGGVRLGTGEFYRVVDELDGVAGSLVVHLEDDSGGAGELILFVVPAQGRGLDDDLRARIAASLRSELSPRHVPDQIVAVDAVPINLTGKKLELPVKRILQGMEPERVASRDALADPRSLDAYVAFAHQRA